jgi:acetoin utilization protein AcuC
MTVPNFFFRSEMTQYDFGSPHPLRPIRLLRTLTLLSSLSHVQVISPEPATEDDLLSVHSQDYINAVKQAGTSPHSLNSKFGIGRGDNPPFEHMHEKSLWYVGGSIAAAASICNGEKIAFNISGGLHHAHRSQASGFCIYNDCAVAIKKLLGHFKRVAYIDIDVHHGDGVQWLFYDYTDVLTISIHESGRTLFPGTGFCDEIGSSKTNINIPLCAKTTGDIWLKTFTRIVPKAIEHFDPEVIVLQMGSDAHFLDPLGHLEVTAQEWLASVQIVSKLGLPIVALGGGGYNLETVPRMWSGACLVLSGYEPPNTIPNEAQKQLGITHMFDHFEDCNRNFGSSEANNVVEELCVHYPFLA